jgi:hypothetical protein
LLARFLPHEIPNVGGHFFELDPSAWDRFDAATCRELGRLLVSHLAPQIYDIKSVLSSQTVSPVEKPLTLDQLDLEVRTFNCLCRIGVDDRPGGITSLTIRDALNIRSFGIKALVDLLTSIEAAVGNGAVATMRSVQLCEARDSCLPKDCCEVIRRAGSVPASLADFRVPSPPPGIKLQQMGLRNRTLKALKRAGYNKDPTSIGKLTLTEAIQIPNFGAESLCNLLESVERVERHQYPLFSLPQKRDEYRVLLDLIRGHNTIPECVLESNVPPLPRDTVIADLGVQRRTLHILKRYGKDADLSSLAEMSIGQLMEYRGFGETCLVDLLESICRVREAAGYSELGEASVFRRVKEVVSEVSSVPGISQVGQSDPRLGRLLRNLHSGVCTIGDLRDRQDEISILGRLKELEELRDAVLRCLQQTAEAELTDLVVGKQSPPRNKGLVAKYYGFREFQLSTLQEIGKQYNITRERARQICAPTKIAKLSQPPFAPTIDSILAFIRSSIPETCASIERQLVAKGLIEHGTNLESIKRVAEALRRRVVFRIIGSHPSAYALSVTQISWLKQIRQSAGKLVRRFGVATIDEVIDHCDVVLPRDIAHELATIGVQSMEGFHWLDQSAGWFWLHTFRPTRLGSRIRKVLSVCGELPVGELRAAIRRDHHLEGRVPPTSVLLELCRQLTEIDVVGNSVVATIKDDPMKLLRGEERRLVALLLRHGPVCRREDLQEKAKALGMGLPSFWRCLQFCPTISRYAAGVYGLTGAKVTPSMIESLAQRRPGARVVQDHGWTDDGGIWVVYRISPAAIETGVVGIPAAKRNLIQGEFGLRSASGQTVGTLTIKESASWGLGPYLRRTGAEANDYLLMVFQISERVATVCIGDAGLLDEFHAA